MTSEADFDAMVYSEKLKAGWEAIGSFYAQVCCVGGFLCEVHQSSLKNRAAKRRLAPCVQRHPNPSVSNMDLFKLAFLPAAMHLAPCITARRVRDADSSTAAVPPEAVTPEDVLLFIATLHVLARFTGVDGAIDVAYARLREVEAKAALPGVPSPHSFSNNIMPIEDFKALYVTLPALRWLGPWLTTTPCVPGCAI